MTAPRPMSRARRLTLADLIALAESLGFRKSSCVHPDGAAHYVYDWPRPADVGIIHGKHLRLHIRYVRREDGRQYAAVHVGGHHPHAAGAYTMAAAAVWMAEAVEASR